MAGFARSTYERLVQIVDEVKAFVRFEHQQVVTQPLALAEVVHELLEFLRFERTLDVEQLEVVVEGEPWVRANRVKLQQVLINLLKNAAFAIKEKPDGQIRLSLARRDDLVEIAVSDNGCGMSPEVAEQIWEPFFTTKGEQGTGLGLEVSRSIVEGHGGTIACESSIGAGATFTIRLPALESPLAQAPVAVPPIVAAVAPLSVAQSLNS
jgi:two-component system NtrC family sensor kinase